MKHIIRKQILIGMLLGVFIFGNTIPAFAESGPRNAVKIPSNALQNVENGTGSRSESSNGNNNNSNNLPRNARTVLPTAVVLESVHPVNNVLPINVQPNIGAPTPVFRVNSSNSGPGNLEVAKKNFEGAINKLREARNRPKSTDNNLEHDRHVLLQLIRTLLERELLLEEKVKTMSPPRGELEESILKEIASDRVMLEAFKKQAENAKTREEIKAIAKQIHNKHKDLTNKKVRRMLLAIFFGRLEKEHTKKLELRAERIEKQLEELEGQGKNIDQLRALLTQAEGMIENILADIKEKRMEVNQSEISEVRLNELRDILEGIKIQIKKVHTVFQEIYEGIEEL